MRFELRTQKRDARLPGYDQYRKTKHFGSLNGLRFFCILAVLWHHAPVWVQFPDAPRLFQSGYMGVDFFFVLSGFLITTLLLREENKNGYFSLRGFYWRRFLRIVPVYFLVVTAVSAYYIGVKNEREYLDLLPFYYLFLSNFLVSHISTLEPTWSLSVEEQYYLVWPILLLLLPRRFILYIVVGLILLNVLAATGSLQIVGIRPLVIGPLVLKMFTATYAPILIGSGLAILLHSKTGFEAIRPILGSQSAAPVTLLLLLGLVSVRPTDVTGWPNLLIHLTMATCLAAIVIREDHLLRKFLILRPIARVGEISYGIYLYHLISLHVSTVFLTKIGWTGDWYIFAFYSLFAVGMAEMSFRYYESIFLNLRHKKVQLRRRGS